MRDRFCDEEDDKPRSGQKDGPAIPAFRPLLPRAESLTPYLRRIDSTRVYTNWGPLARELEGRLASRWGLPENGVASAASGTAALVAAILANAGRATADRQLALIPAYTFVATAVAAELCGYRPYFVDVDPDTWLLTTDVERHPILAGVGLVIPVAAFGRGVDQASWLGFRQRTGVPVIIDGGASFEAVSDDPGRHLGEIPVALSFHATKSFSTGEGGCVVSSNLPAMTSIVRALNFGFHESRDCRSASINGKMSEYHAAVGLAELDGWEAKRSAFLAVGRAYCDEFRSAGVTDRLIVAPALAGCYAAFQCLNRDEAERRRVNLRVARIETRRWYGCGLHRQPHYASLPHDTVDNTERIAALTITLPMAPDLTNEVVSRIVASMLGG